MAETAIAAVLSKFGELAAREAKILLEVGDDMALLRDRLEWLQAFIRDADTKRRAGTDQLTLVWVRQTRDVAFQAEDALDQFVYQADLKSQGYRSWKKMWYRYLTGFCTQIVGRHGLSARVKRINMRLAKISDNQKEYNIGYKPLASVTSYTAATSSWSDDAVAIHDKVMVLGEMLLCEDRPRLMFISIIGESGVGKNTIVINTLDLEGLLEFKVIWFKVPPGATLGTVLMEIYKRAAYDRYLTEEGDAVFHNPKGDGNGIHDDDDITDKIRRVLTGKRYLLILGGTYSKTIFNCVRASLPDDHNGSRVLLVIDTENEQVGWHANTMNQAGVNGIVLLSRLDKEDSGLLFRSRASTREELRDYGDMMTANNMYNKIVYDITGGYPLAIVVLAGLLRFKESPGQWEAVLQQLWSAGPRRMEEVVAMVQGGSGSGEGQQQQQKIEANNKLDVSLSTESRTTMIERVFWASFEDLPDDLKSCFLYFATFRENVDSSALQVVRMWVAEGFIKPRKGGKTLEELGHNYLKELVLRCLVQVEGGHNNFDGIIDSLVRIHPRLIGLLHSEAREAGFMEAHDISMMPHVFVPPSVRRLSCMGFGGRYTTTPSPFTNKQFPKLRTFTCSWFGQEGEEQEQRQRSTYNGGQQQPTIWHDVKFLCGSKLIRVIYLEGLRIKELPDKIGDMIHLRFLGVISSKDLKEIPSSVKRLLNLQTLDIRGTQVDKIDPGFWEIRTLRHVLADKLTLPENSIVEDEELGELQTLQGVKPAAAATAAAGGGRRGGEWTQHNCPLHRMTKLRSLYLHGISRDKHWTALESALAKMHLLGRLELQGDIPSCVFTARSLRCLQVLGLIGTVEWPEVGWDASKVRPNLVMLQLRTTNEVPQHMQAQINRIQKRNDGFTPEISTATQGDDVEEILIE
ncbi:unnamed protein product [Urochloa decumbens]|uniref:Uncharacterized protein n=1 Tax=Urochloa decumbens TaxID=240449 RepID=A0ABC8VDT5_9POAL